MASIALSRIVKQHGRSKPVLDGVSLEIADGELLVLVGPSGCGKSTLLRIIAGLEDATSGEVRIDGERVNEKAPRERNLAMVFQSYALYPHLSVFDNIAFPLRLSGRRGEEEIRRRVEETARLLELAPLLERRPRQLSGGQRQRVAMGRVLVREARAFLLDEPLSNLDARLRGQMRTEIARLQRRLRMTTVYVTHDQTEAMTLGDRVAVLREGQLEQVATPRELYRRPANLFVASAIGSPPMNLMPGAVDGRRLRLPFAEVELAEEAARQVGDRGVVLAGVRPEDLEEAGLAAARRARGVAFRVGVDVVEWLGDVQYAYAPYTVPREVSARVGAVLREMEPEPLRAQLTVALDAASRAQEGETIELWLDPGRIHLFDPETGDSLAREGPLAGR